MKHRLVFAAFITLICFSTYCPDALAQRTTWRSLNAGQKRLFMGGSKEPVTYNKDGSVRWGATGISKCPPTDASYPEESRIYISPLSQKRGLFVVLCWEDGKGGFDARVVNSKTKTVTRNIVPKDWGIGAWVNWSSNEEFALFFASGEVTMGDMVWVNLDANKSGPLEYKHFTNNPHPDQYMEETQDANTDKLVWITPTTFKLPLEVHCNPYELGEKCDPDKVLRSYLAQVDVNTLTVSYPSSSDSPNRLSDIKSAPLGVKQTDEKARLDFTNGDFRALHNFVTKHLPSKGPFEKTVEYEANLDRVLNQKVVRDLTAKSLWSFSMPFCGKSVIRECFGWNGDTEYNPDTEIFLMTFWASYPLELYFNQNGSLFGKPPPFRCDFQGDYSKLGLPSTVQYLSKPTYLISFKVSPEEARLLSGHIGFEVSFVPALPFLSKDRSDILHGSVKQLKIFHTETGKIYARYNLSNKAESQPLPDKTGVASSKLPVSLKPSLVATYDYRTFLGTWSYVDGTQRWYFNISKDSQGRFAFVDAFQYEEKVTWRSDVMLTKTTGIFLNPTNGKLDGKFVSGNFTATRGRDVPYRITLQPQSDGKLLYVLYMGGYSVGKFYAVKI